MAILERMAAFAADSGMVCVYLSWWTKADVCILLIVREVYWWVAGKSAVLCDRVAECLEEGFNMG